MHYLSVNMNNVIFNFKRQFPRMCPIGDPTPPPQICATSEHISLVDTFFIKRITAQQKIFGPKC